MLPAFPLSYAPPIGEASAPAMANAGCAPAGYVSTGSRRLTLPRNHVRKEDEFFEVEMMVRDDDLDEYGVVNNAIYASYIERGRDLLLEKLGIKVSYVAATGKAMALSELNLKYFKPLKSGDRFIVKVKPVKITGVRLIVHHIIETLPDRKLVLDAKATAVFLNEDYCPTRVFPELSARSIPPPVRDCEVKITLCPATLQSLTVDNENLYLIASLQNRYYAPDVC
ncbi:hypothetical protein QOZ80_4AG0308070 [Eleusine coracana subsp. coracana]|nr:hypothetical protein QOZ80_4AG0308070 [Eleusine coracana subsp. coracana]